MLGPRGVVRAVSLQFELIMRGQADRGRITAKCLTGLRQEYILLAKWEIVRGRNRPNTCFAAELENEVREDEQWRIAYRQISHFRVQRLHLVWAILR